MKKSKDSLQDLWDNVKWINIHIIGIPECEERQKGEENPTEEIMVESFPTQGKKIDIQIQEAQRVPNKMKQTDPHQTALWLSCQKLNTRTES